MGHGEVKVALVGEGLPAEEVTIAEHMIQTAVRAETRTRRLEQRGDGIGVLDLLAAVGGAVVDTGVDDEGAEQLDRVAGEAGVGEAIPLTLGHGASAGEHAIENVFVISVDPGIEYGHRDAGSVAGGPCRGCSHLGQVPLVGVFWVIDRGDRLEQGRQVLRPEIAGQPALPPGIEPGGLEVR